MSGIYNAIQTISTPQSMRNIANGITQNGNKAVQDALANKPQMPNMMPEPKMAALMALLSGLSNNQFRPDDDPFQHYLSAYQNTAQSQYQQALDKWQKQQDQANLTQQNANAQADVWNKRADTAEQNVKDDQSAIANYNQRVQTFNNAFNAYRQHPGGIDPQTFQKLENEAISLDSLRHSMHLNNGKLFNQLTAPVDIYGGKSAKDYYAARDATDMQKATNNAMARIPTRYQSFAPYIEGGIKKTQDVLNSNASTPADIQMHLGNTFRRHEALSSLLEQMHGMGYDQADPNSPEFKAYQSAFGQYNANAAQLPLLAARNPGHPSTTQSNFLLQAAKNAVQNNADEEPVIGRLRKLLAGQPAKDPSNPFSDLIPTHP